LGESRYNVNCTLVAAQECAGATLALYHHKRTLHAVQLIFLGSKWCLLLISLSRFSANYVHDLLSNPEEWLFVEFKGYIGSEAA
jgi:hypothetical protein